MEDRDSDDCCGPAADPRVARRFDRSWSDWDDEDGFPPMVDVSAVLLDLLRDAPLVRPSVLEIGCGTGGVSVALLEMGARRVKGVDLSPASVDLARRRAAAARLRGEQATFEVGQGAAVRDERHDWVVLDRVLCCDGHLDRMLDAVIGAAGGAGGAVGPGVAWLARVAQPPDVGGRIPLGPAHRWLPRLRP